MLNFLKNSGVRKERLKMKFKGLWLAGNMMLLSKRLTITNVVNEQININGNSLKNLFIQKSLKLFVVCSDDAITNPDIIKKKKTPKFPY